MPSSSSRYRHLHLRWLIPPLSYYLSPASLDLSVRDGTATMAAVAATWPGPMSATDGDLASGSEEDEGGGRGPKHESGRRWQLLQRFLSSYEPTTPCSRRSNRQVSLCKFRLCSCVVFSSLQQHRRLDRSWKQGITCPCSCVQIRLSSSVLNLKYCTCEKSWIGAASPEYLYRNYW